MKFIEFAHSYSYSFIGLNQCVTCCLKTAACNCLAEEFIQRISYQESFIQLPSNCEQLANAFIRLSSAMAVDDRGLSE